MRRKQTEKRRDPDVLFGQVSSGQTLQRILQTYLPSRPQIDRRLAVYFNARYLVVPVLHSRVFQRQYEEFWRDPTTASPLVGLNTVLNYVPIS